MGFRVSGDLGCSVQDVLLLSSCFQLVQDYGNQVLLYCVVLCTISIF